MARHRGKYEIFSRELRRVNKLGFGFLRLPMLKNAEGQTVDIERTKRLVDLFYEKGGRCFDTAYTYLDGLSEPSVRECVVKRYPREEIHLTDKLPTWKLSSYEMCRKRFEEMKERCGVDYFDQVMLHWLTAEHYALCQSYDGFRFLRELKETGQAKEIGFSFHDTADVLDRILTEHPEVDQVLLQINYLDWESPAIQSRRCYETAQKHGKKIKVMEPVKGGTLATLPPEAMEILERVKPGRSPAQWAIAFAASLPGVSVVLSGMSSVEQVSENCAVDSRMTQEEYDALKEVVGVLRRTNAIPCTSCRYCVAGCPKKINIPEHFKLYNMVRQYPEEDWKVKPVYRQLFAQDGGAESCIHCGRCEKSCPQQLPIINWLRTVRETLL